jgi:hypothetical protein
MSSGPKKGELQQRGPDLSTALDTNRPQTSCALLGVGGGGTICLSPPFIPLDLPQTGFLFTLVQYEIAPTSELKLARLD